MHFYCIFEDSSAFPPPLHFFPSKETLTNLENKKVYGKLFLIIYTQLWAPREQFHKVTSSQGDKEELDMVHVLKVLIVYWGI